MGRTIDGITIWPLSALTTLDGERTAVVVFSCFYDEIAAGSGGASGHRGHSLHHGGRQPAISTAGRPGRVLHRSRALLPAAVQPGSHGELAA